MKPSIAVLASVFLLSTSLAHADVSLKKEADIGLHTLEVGASLKSRGESRHNFAFGGDAATNNESFVLTQVRAHLRLAPVEWLTAFVQIQDARIFFEDGINAERTPNVFQDTFDVHQAYLDLSPTIAGIDTNVRIGRQKFNLGAQRLVSSLEWVNTARVWDGARLTVGDPKVRSADAFVSWVVPVIPGRFNTQADSGAAMFDSALHGFYLTDKAWVPGHVFDAYALFRGHSELDDAVWTFGGRVNGKAAGFDYEVEGAGQVGTFRGETHRAGMAHVHAGYTFAKLAKTRIGAAYNFGTGDSDPNDGVNETFDNLYPLNHAYYGYMDFFSLQNVHNLEATIQTKPFAGFTARVAYQGFFLAEEDTDAWYNAPGGVVRRAEGDARAYVGSEVDVTVGYAAFEKRMKVNVGYGHFFAGGFVADTGPAQDADFGYLQLLLKI